MAAEVSAGGAGAGGARHGCGSRGLPRSCCGWCASASTAPNCVRYPYVGTRGGRRCARRTAPAQLVHQKRRSESHHDLVAQLRSGEPPEDCLTLPFLQALWDWSRPTPWTGPRPAPASAEPAAVHQAYRAGFRYLIAWRAGFDMLRQAGLDVDREQSIARLTSVLGPPLVSDDTLVAWAIPEMGRP